MNSFHIKRMNIYSNVITSSLIKRNLIKSNQQIRCNQMTKKILNVIRWHELFPGMSSWLELVLQKGWSSTGKPWDRSSSSLMSSLSSLPSPSTSPLSHILIIISVRIFINFVIAGTPCVAWPVPGGLYRASKFSLPLSFWELLQVILMMKNHKCSNIILCCCKKQGPMSQNWGPKKISKEEAKGKVMRRN